MKRFFSTLLLAFFIAISGTQSFVAFAANSDRGMLPIDWDQYSFDDTKAFNDGEGIDLPKSKKQGGLEQLQDLVINNIGQITRYLLISISVLYLFVNILILILGSSDESTIEKVRGTAGYIMLGLMLVGMSTEIAKVFDPVAVGGGIGDIAQAKSTLQIIINYIALIAGGVAIFYMLISAMKIITAQGEEDVITEEKKDFQYGFTGLIVITMADVMINKVFYPEDIQAPGIGEVQTFAQEVFALLRYVLEYGAIIAIVFMILAGFYYIISLGEDENTETAKTIFKNLIIGFILIVIAYTLVSAVSPNVAGQVIAQ